MLELSSEALVAEEMIVDATHVDVISIAALPHSHALVLEHAQRVNLKTFAQPAPAIT